MASTPPSINLQTVKQRFGIVGRNEELDNALRRAIDVAPTDLTVLITGESGVGKEVFSKVIHSLSQRKHNPFIAVNCGAIPEGTINSELFGHVKGSFTGAAKDRKGYFEAVDGGTIFLDEVGEMPLETQTLLLRVLESGEFIPVGAEEVKHTDVRVVAATNVKLLENVEKGKFRRDLYYRLSTVPIEVPPLHRRKEDIYLLFRKFAVDFAEKYHTTPVQLDDDARRLLEQYTWPGNIRELKNMAEQISVLAKTKLVAADELLDFLPNISKRNLPAIPPDHRGGNDSFQEREILYKLLFDMKKDLNDLKSLVFELIRTNDLRMPDARQLPALSPFIPLYDSPDAFDKPSFTTSDDDYTPPSANEHHSRPFVIEKNTEFREIDAADALLRLDEMEKGMIRKALKKYKGRRKDAANELGISERTLYRKIKEYDIEE